ncbi:MAG: dienelactone hydrolase family protein [Gammaproteobacteria bacterium]|nr:dienelactone hydrolase family protein [Gammaproteobacteria bacterium]
MRTTAVGLLVALLATTQLAEAAERLSYRAGGADLKGYLAVPKNVQGKRPGVLVVHEWWGQTDYIRKRADMLAELGYVALAVDMYGDGKVANHPKDAGAFAGEVRKNMDVGEARFRAALDLLRSQPSVDPDRIAAIGYCFGGGMVIEMARRGVDLDGVVSFHGSLGAQDRAEPGVVKAKILVLNGADDPFVKAEQIEALKQEMARAGADLRFINYPGAVHGFTNPDATENGQKFDLPLRYDANVDAQSWREMQAFFDEVLQ